MEAPDDRRQPLPRAAFAQEAKAKIVGRLADCAAAEARVPNEVGHIRSVPPLDDADAAIDDRRPIVDRDRIVMDQTRVSPLRDVPGEVEHTVLVGAEAADRARMAGYRFVAIGLDLITPEPPLGLVDSAVREHLVTKSAAR